MWTREVSELLIRPLFSLILKYFFSSRPFSSFGHSNLKCLAFCIHSKLWTFVFIFLFFGNSSWVAFPLGSTFVFPYFADLSWNESELIFIRIFLRWIISLKGFGWAFRDLFFGRWCCLILLTAESQDFSLLDPSSYEVLVNEPLGYWLVPHGT